MSIWQFFLIIFTVFLLAAGQILFKIASDNLIITARGFIPSLFDPAILVALAVYGVATVLWLIALKGMPLRVAYPFVALAFVIVPTLAHYLLGESVGWNTYVGALIIGVGVFVSVYK